MPQTRHPVYGRHTGAAQSLHAIRNALPPGATWIRVPARPRWLDGVRLMPGWFGPGLRWPRLLPARRAVVHAA